MKDKIFYKAARDIFALFGITAAIILLFFGKVEFTDSDQGKDRAAIYEACNGLTKQNLIICQNNERRHQELMQSNQEIKSQINLLPTY